MLHHRKPQRLYGFDYSSERYYFVTSCTQNRVHYFGNVQDGKMNLNIYGEIVQQQWHWLGEHFSYLDLIEFVVMPNHIHGIIFIDNNDYSLQKIKSLSEIMGAFKTTSSKKIHLAGLPEFLWQRSFHDHIIRNDISFQRIQNYIQNNPINWTNDTYFIQT